ncbi:hypothetical protein [Dactylosporangium sp. NPDC005555]|uniref:hypothetical protein n=1 Tax=Dactylosporangium sp. NPDC005555 TaxID=3154889 RepID=UPI00339E27C5
MTNVRAGLRALADRAPRGSLPDGFYEAARARHRGRRAAALAAVAVLLVVVGAGWAVRAGGGPSVPAGGSGPGIATELPVPPWYTGSGGLGVTAAVYGGPATTGDWQEGRLAGLSADGDRVRVLGGAVYAAPGFEVLLSPDGTRIAHDGTVSSLTGGADIRVPGEVRAFSPDGTLVVYQSGGTVGVHDLARHTDVARVDVGGSWVVPGFSAAVAPGNDRLALMTNQAVSVYDLRTSRLLYLLRWADGVLTGPGAWLPDGSAFATATRTNDVWTVALHAGADGTVLADRALAPVFDARYLRLLGWRADGTAVAVAGVPAPGAVSLENSWTTAWGPYTDLGSSGARLVEIRPDGVREVLRTPAGVRDLDVAASLAIAGSFLPPGDPGFGARSNPVVYVSSMCVFVGGAMLAAVLVHRRRVRRRDRG